MQTRQKTQRTESVEDLFAEARSKARTSGDDADSNEDGSDTSEVVSVANDDGSDSDSESDNESAPKLKMRKTRKRKVLHFDDLEIYESESSKDVLKGSSIYHFKPFIYFTRALFSLKILSHCSEPINVG